jgi:hypothetical protein
LPTTLMRPYPVTLDPGSMPRIIAILVFPGFAPLAHLKTAVKGDKRADE